MNKRSFPPVLAALHWGALQIAGIYLILGGTWILFSDRLAARVAVNTEMLATISLYKGWGYVLVTALLLFWMIQRHTASLRASELQLQRVIDALPAFIAYVGADRRYRFTNKTYEERYNQKAEGKHIEELIGEAAYSAIAGYVEKALAGQVVNYETDIPFEDVELFMAVTYIPDLAEDGRVKGFFVLAQDRTAQRQAEEERRLWADAFEGCAHGIAIGDPNTNRIVVCNPAFAGLQKSRVEDIVGSAILSLYAPSDHENVRRNIQKADQIGHASFEARMIRMSQDRSPFPVQMDVVSVLGEDGELLHRVVTAQDISERKQIEKALQEAHAELELKVQERTAALSEANALLQALMDNIPDHIYFKDTQCRFIRNSRSQATLLGLQDPSETVGKTDFDFFPHAAQSYADEQEVMRSGKPHVDFEEWVVWPDGRETWVTTTKMPLRNSERQTIGIFGISHDITQRKRAEQAIRQLNTDLETQAEQLQAANKELEAFSYSVSHDLRAPLRAIDGYTRILVEDYEVNLDSEGKRVCGVISREARRMGQLIDDLLAFSRLGRKEMYSSRIDMNALAGSVFEELIKEENRERIDFTLARLPMAKGDSSLIRQVWVNLLSNAIKFTSRKGRSVIEVGSKHTREESIYYVRDNGAGFDMEYANKLFGVFQRLHSESEFSGTGVGLAIVQRIIRRHGGRVWAQGEVEKGATFYFALPRKENFS